MCWPPTARVEVDFCAGKRVQVAVRNADQEFQPLGCFLVTLRLQSTSLLGEKSSDLEPPGFVAAPVPLVEGRGASLAGEKGGWSL